MRKDTALHLVAIGLAIILFLVGYLMRTLPLWFMVIAFTLGGLFLIVGILGLTGIWAKLVNGLRKYQLSISITKRTGNQVTVRSQSTELESLRERLPVLKSIESALNAGTVDSYLDLCFNKMLWRGLEKKSYLYIVAECAVSSRFPYEMVFVDKEKIPFNLTIVDEKAGEQKDRRWKIAEQAKLVWLQSTETEETMEFRGECQVPALSHILLDFQFDLQDSRVGEKIRADYAHSPSKEIPKIKLEFDPKWQLKIVQSGKTVCFGFTSPIAKVFDIDISS